MGDDTEEAPDVLKRRLDYAVTIVNIIGAVLVVGYMLAAIDEMTGGSLRRAWERRRDIWRDRLKRQKQFDQEVRRVEFEAWRALQEGQER